jgi:hypothetical protein
VKVKKYLSLGYEQFLKEKYQNYATDRESKKTGLVKPCFWVSKPIKTG